MDMDVHTQRNIGPSFTEGPMDALPIDHHLGMGDGRFQRPVLRGDTINFRNIDGPRSLMTAWKKLVTTSPTLRRESETYLSRGRPRRGRGLREHEVDYHVGLGRLSPTDDSGMPPEPDTF